MLPEGNDDRILKAAARLIAQDIVKLTILGDSSEIAAAIKRLGLTLDISKINIVNPASSEYYEDFVHTLYELRKNKNVTLEMARDLMTDVSYFGTMMVYKGYADGMVSGAVHTTQHTIRPALQFIKTKPGVSIVSSVFFMCLPEACIGVWRLCRKPQSYCRAVSRDSYFIGREQPAFWHRAKSSHAVILFRYFRRRCRCGKGAPGNGE